MLFFHLYLQLFNLFQLDDALNSHMIFENSRLFPCFFSGFPRFSPWISHGATSTHRGVHRRPYTFVVPGVDIRPSFHQGLARKRNLWDLSGIKNIEIRYWVDRLGFDGHVTCIENIMTIRYYCGNDVEIDIIVCYSCWVNSTWDFDGIRYIR